MWNRVKRSLSRKEIEITVAAPALPPEQALAQAKAEIAGLQLDERTIGQQLAFASSLLTAVGEDPSTPQNQVLVHQMALEQIRARQALLAR